MASNRASVRGLPTLPGAANSAAPASATFVECGRLTEFAGFVPLAAAVRADRPIWAARAWPATGGGPQI